MPIEEGQTSQNGNLIILGPKRKLVGGDITAKTEKFGALSGG